MVLKRKNRIIAFLVILVGVLIFSYPYWATLVNDYFASRQIHKYDEKMNKMDKDELKEMMDLALAYNQSLPRDYPADPFSGENIYDFKGTKFENFPMVQEGAMIGYLEVPSIDIYLPVYYGTTDKIVEKNLGLVENTSLPVGGPGTHAVIAGHTGMASRRLFSDLNQMKKGDLFFVHVLNRHFAYKVDQISVVLPDRTEKLAIRKKKDLVTLLTCTPFGVNDHRLLVRGARTDYDFSSKDAGGKGALLSFRDIILIAIALFTLLVLMKMIRDRKKERMNIKE